MAGPSSNDCYKNMVFFYILVPRPERRKVLWKRCGWMDVVNINGIYSLPELLDWRCGFVVVLHGLQHRMVPNPTKFPHSITI